jgi:hypothetical protein
VNPVFGDEALLIFVGKAGSKRNVVREGSREEESEE